MEELLSKDTVELLNKYKDIEPTEHINGIDICYVDESDLYFMLGYISASLRIQNKLKNNIRQLNMDKEEMYELATRAEFDNTDWKEFERIFSK